MMRYLIIAVAMTLFGFLPTQATAEIVVIMNPASEIDNLTRRQVVDNYMGRALIASNGKKLVPYDNAADSAVREVFYRQLIGKSVASVNAYWAGLLFSGRASPPRRVADSAMMLETIENNPQAIGYINIQDLNDKVTIVFRITIDK